MVEDDRERVRMDASDLNPGRVLVQPVLSPRARREWTLNNWEGARRGRRPLPRQDFGTQSCFSTPGHRSSSLSQCPIGTTGRGKRGDSGDAREKQDSTAQPAAAAAINFNKYPIKPVDRQLMDLGEKWVTSKTQGPFRARCVGVSRCGDCV